VHERGLITKSEIRVVGLSKLGIRPNDTIWDVGAGCGSFAIEASYLARDGRVFAIEKNAARIAHIRENIKRTGAYHVEVIHGRVPDCLKELPVPDGIFLGGGLSEGKEILEILLDELKVGGRVVAHTVLLESLSTIKEVLDQRRLPYDITMLQICRSRPISSDMRFSSLNPIFVVCARKEDSMGERDG
jgi:precorrin-6Y C5,15-methyltransferase (decarboxylating)